MHIQPSSALSRFWTCLTPRANAATDERALAEWFQGWLGGLSHPLIWYLSAGFDLLPVKHFVTPGQPLPVFFYTDYGHTADGLPQLTKKGQRQTFHQHDEEFIIGPLLAFDWQLPPATALPAEMEALAITKSGPPAGYQPNGHLWLMQVQYKDGPAVPVFYWQQENFTAAATLWYPLAMPFQHIITVTDGCRQGGNPWCPNTHWKALAPLLAPGGWWITDHFNEPLPEAFRRVKVFNQWGHYHLHDQSCAYILSKESKNENSGLYRGMP